MMPKVWLLFDGRVLSSQIQAWIRRLWAARLLPSSLELQTKFLTGGLREEEIQLCHLSSKNLAVFLFFHFLWEKPCKIHYFLTAKDGNCFLNHIRFSFEFSSFFPERAESSAFDHLKPLHWYHLTKRLRSYLLVWIKDATAHFWSKCSLKISNTPPLLSGTRSASIFQFHVKLTDENVCICTTSHLQLKPDCYIHLINVFSTSTKCFLFSKCPNNETDIFLSFFFTYQKSKV